MRFIVSYCCSSLSGSHDRLQNCWVQEDHIECFSGSQRPAITTNREDRHLTHMVVMERMTTSWAPSQEVGSFQENKCRHDQFDYVSSSMDMNSQLATMASPIFESISNGMLHGEYKAGMAWGRVFR